MAVRSDWGSYARQTLLALPAKVGDDQRSAFEAVFQGMDNDDGEELTIAGCS
jgi:hypothetical protein